jgi:predicted membrane GTPase involved in stress response
MAEAETNLAINVLPAIGESYEVQGRGELQLGLFFLTLNCVVLFYFILSIKNSQY